MSEQAAVDFDAEKVIALARDKTGLDNFGSTPWREGLEVLLATYDRHVRDPGGRARCRDRVVNLLATRLRCERAFEQIPAIQDETIEAPIFVTGLPRSGTSALLNLLANAPENRGLLQWEMQLPDPWPGSAPGDEDPRYRPLADALEASRNKAFMKMHDGDADTPEECVLLHAYACSGVQLGFEIMLEPYGSWLKAQDLEPLYAYQRQLMKMLQWRNPGKQRWLLKAPAHMWGIDAIMKVFPDARFIWCHRNPLQVVPSINSMNQLVMAMYAGDCSHVDPHEMGRSVMDWYATSLERGLAERKKLPEHLFVDCSQQEFVDRPMALVERVYGAFDMPLSVESRSALEAHIDSNPKNKHGKHVYDLSAYGLDEAAIRQRFDFYYSDPRWPISD